MNYLFLLLFASTLATAADQNFCEVRQSREKISEHVRHPENLLTLVNDGGLFGIRTGVCWWHSRLQRKLSYLALFRPELPKPTDHEVKKILSHLKSKNEVITIPGYNNVQEFSLAHAERIQKSLNAWMAGDSLLRFSWVKGLEGRTHFKKKLKLNEHLNEVYEEFQKSDGLMTQILQVRGLGAHAWIVTNILKRDDGKFEVEFFESNTPNQVFRYLITGDHSFAPLKNRVQPRSSTPESGRSKSQITRLSDFVGYTNFKGELKQLKKAVSDYCESDAQDP